MPLSEVSRRQFAELFEYCRGNNDVPSGVRDDRAPTYQRLVKNIVFGNLEKAYPIARKRLTKNEWHTLTERFFSTWNSPSPELWRMPYALVEFVENTEIAHNLQLPWLPDLLRFEWAEILAFMMPDYQYQDQPEPIVDLWSDTLAMNQEHVLLELSYPVHHKLSRQELSEEGKYFVICYRHPRSLEAMYMEVSHFFFQMFQELLAQERTAEEILDLIIEEAAIVENAVSKSLREQIQGFLETLATNGLILGRVKNKERQEIRDLMEIKYD